jgi:endoglucanase
MENENFVEVVASIAQAFGPSGHEKNVREILEPLVAGYVDEVRVDALGNLIAIKKGTGRKIMLSAHMDEIGVLVTYIDEKGYLRFGNVGGVSPHIALGTRVIFENGTVGTVWYEEKLEGMKDLKLDRMFIDIGATSRGEAEKLVRVGDMAVFCGDTVETNGRIISKAMDNRSSCAVLVALARSLPETENEIYYVFSAQEEVGLRGARTAAWGLQPDVALAVDVTATGDMPESRHMAVAIGKGPAIKIKDNSVICHPDVVEQLRTCAAEKDIAVQYEVLTFGGTDAGAIHLTGAGIPTGAVSIPTHFIHSPSEMVSVSDMLDTVDLLAAFVQA